MCRFSLRALLVTHHGAMDSKIKNRPCSCVHCGAMKLLSTLRDRIFTQIPNLKSHLRFRLCLEPFRRRDPTEPKPDSNSTSYLAPGKPKLRTETRGHRKDCNVVIAEIVVFCFLQNKMPKSTFIGVSIITNLVADVFIAKSAEVARSMISWSRTRIMSRRAKHEFFKSKLECGLGMECWLFASRSASTTETVKSLTHYP